MVLWDEAREDVFKFMEVNQVNPSTAELLYASARKDRVRMIRSEHLRKLFIGGSLSMAAAIVFFIFWFVIGVIPNLLLYACFAAFGFGAWKCTDGIAGYAMAHNKEGSIADEI